MLDFRFLTHYNLGVSYETNSFRRVFMNGFFAENERFSGVLVKDGRGLSKIRKSGALQIP